MKSKKYKIATLGCRTNQYESQAYADQLRALGYEEAQEGEGADICIVNTCTVTESADSTSRQQIRRLARTHPGSRLVVTGCLAERLPEEIKAIEGVNIVIPNKKKEKLIEELFPDLGTWPEFAIEQFQAHTRAFVKVQDGCNSYCTYCILPYVRGRSRSRPLPEIIAEVERLVANGYKEVVLTGINIGDYEEEEGGRLAALVRAVDKVEGLERLRISSIDPDEVDEELMQTVLEGEKTCPSFHIVLQAGSNVVLKRMNRKYTRQIFLDTVEKLQKASADFTFTTDIIVGFPGETEQDFAETLAVMRQVQFAKVHMFPYSVRERTRAALFPNRVPPEVIAERKQQVLRLSEEYAFLLRQKYVGRTLSLLIENKEEGGVVTGHTANFLPVSLPEPGLQANDLVRVRCVANTPQGLRGEVCHAH